ncbi:hypothetical protein [Microcoleus sp. D3_18a_C4]|uniref:hypothetical protein n=1 Tax=Microcoleus sp. D3_18a_C4 TaxID=3055332 RepID=UPI002FD4FBBE
MNFEALVLALEERIRFVCGEQARYRVLWVVGKPRSGKTLLSRTVCQRTSWRYIDFTLDPGFLDSLTGREESYHPEDFLGTIKKLIDNKVATEIVAIDEIESLLSLWNWEQQEVFFKQVGRATRLPIGVVLVTRNRTTQELLKIIPGMNHIFEMPEEVQL